MSRASLLCVLFLMTGLLFSVASSTDDNFADKVSSDLKANHAQRSAPPESAAHSLLSAGLGIIKGYYMWPNGVFFSRGAELNYETSAIHTLHPDMLDYPYSGLGAGFTDWLLDDLIVTGLENAQIGYSGIFRGTNHPATASFVFGGGMDDEYYPTTADSGPGTFDFAWASFGVRWMQTFKLPSIAMGADLDSGHLAQSVRYFAQYKGRYGFNLFDTSWMSHGSIASSTDLQYTPYPDKNQYFLNKFLIGAQYVVRQDTKSIVSSRDHFGNFAIGGLIEVAPGFLNPVLSVNKDSFYDSSAYPYAANYYSAGLYATWFIPLFRINPHVGDLVPLQTFEGSLYFYTGARWMDGLGKNGYIPLDARIFGNNPGLGLGGVTFDSTANDGDWNRRFGAYVGAGITFALPDFNTRILGDNSGNFSIIKTYMYINYEAAYYNEFDTSGSSYYFTRQGNAEAAENMRNDLKFGLSFHTLPISATFELTLEFAQHVMNFDPLVGDFGHI